MSICLFPPQHLTFWVIQQVLNQQPCHPYMRSFHVFLCMVRVLKTVWIGHVSKGRDALHHFSHSSVKSIVICKSHCHSLCLCSVRKFLWLVLGWNTSGLFSRNFIKRFLSGILCLVTFCFRTVGEITLLIIWMFSNIQLRKGLDARCCFSALCLFLCHVLLREINVFRCFLDKTLAYLFLRICWIISSQHFPQSVNSPKFDSFFSVYYFQDIQNIDDLKKMQTSNIILFALLWNIFRRDVTKIERPCLQRLLWVHGLRFPMLCLSWHWVEDKADSDENQNLVLLWPCRTAEMASNSSAMPSKSLEPLLT